MTHAQDGSLYLSSFNFDGDRCELVLSAQNGAREIVAFSFVRSFFFYKESDFFNEIKNYEKRYLPRADNLPSCVFEIINEPLTEKVLCGRFDNEEPMYFGVWTPDECFEIVCFESPTIVLGSSSEP